MTYQTKLRTDEIIPNENICFPIGTILACNCQIDFPAKIVDILDEWNFLTVKVGF